MTKQKRFLHLNTERTEYSVTVGELQRLENASQNHWKDFCIASFAIGIPCAINGFTALNFDSFEITAPIFFNCLFGTVGIGAGIILGVAWYKTYSSFKDIISDIKNKPKVDISDLDLESSVDNVGELDGENKKVKEEVE